MYHPNLGRWATMDPIGFAGGTSNQYMGLDNNPVTLLDPLGLAAISYPFKKLAEGWVNELWGDTAPKLGLDWDKIGEGAIKDLLNTNIGTAVNLPRNVAITAAVAAIASKNGQLRISLDEKVVEESGKKVTKLEDASKIKVSLTGGGATSFTFTKPFEILKEKIGKIGYEIKVEPDGWTVDNSANPATATGSVKVTLKVEIGPWKDEDTRVFGLFRLHAGVQCAAEVMAHPTEVDKELLINGNRVFGPNGKVPKQIQGLIDPQQPLPKK